MHYDYGGETVKDLIKIAVVIAVVTLVIGVGIGWLIFK